MSQWIAIFAPILRQLFIVFGAAATLGMFVCFGNSSFLKYTPVGWVHQMFARVLVAVGYICGNRYVESCRVYVFESLNPFMQIVYASLVLGGYFIFLRDIFPYIGPDFLYLSHCAVAATMLSFFLACYCDPGVINSENHHLHRHSFPYDNLLYKSKDCETCRIQSSLHNAYAQDLTIIARNVRLFITFLLMTAFVCLYEAWLSFQLARLHYGQLTVAWREQLMQARRPLVPLPSNIALAHLLHDLHLAVPLGMFCGLMGIVVLLFACYHIYLVLRNTTTNETFKWGDVASSLKWYDRRRMTRARLLAEREAGRAPPAKPKPAPGSSDADAKAKKTREQPAEGEPDESRNSGGDDDSDAEIETIKMPTKEQLGNVYNRGAWSNVREVLFPPSLHAANNHAADKVKRG